MRPSPPAAAASRLRAIMLRAAMLCASNVACAVFVAGGTSGTGAGADSAGRLSASGTRTSAMLAASRMRPGTSSAAPNRTIRAHRPPVRFRAESAARRPMSARRHKEMGGRARTGEAGGLPAVVPADRHERAAARPAWESGMHGIIRRRRCRSGGGGKC